MAASVIISLQWQTHPMLLVSAKITLNMLLGNCSDFRTNPEKKSIFGYRFLSLKYGSANATSSSFSAILKCASSIPNWLFSLKHIIFKIFALGS
mmetsp:Transcript_23265/g.17686  ORF Transcript_23265/g.17686 Transcript_23265/m.17686 type:complete len:94 (+) Transcript_23265:148-429(+)